mgnify:FL=1
MNLDDKRKVKIGIGIAAFAVLLYLGLQNMDVVARTVRFMLGLFSPFIVGVCIAFVLNLLMNFLEKHVFFFLNRRKLPKWEKIRRPVSIVLTLVIFLGLMALLIYFLIPMLRESVMTLWGNLPGYAANLERWANRFLAPFNLSADLAETLSQFVYQFSDSILKYLTESMPKIFETATNIASGIFNAITGFIISVYFLAGKEKLVRNLKRSGYAFLPRKAADYLCHVYHLVNDRFTGFVSGQLTEAFILGLICFVGMKIIGAFLGSGWEQYALLISTMIGLTNIIPIIGPILGTIPGALIMLMVDPVQAVLFVIYIVVLQQIESNFIYPRVVGTSVGLPGLWVLAAVLIGGNLFGLTGIVLGVPALSVIYVLFREAVEHRLKERQLKV